MADRLRLQVLLDAVDKVSGPLKRIMGGAGAAAGGLKSASAALGGLKRLSGDITNYQRLRTELRGVSRNLEEARGRTASAAAVVEQMRNSHHALAGEVKAARAALKQHSADLARAEQPSAALTAAYTQQKARLAELEKRYSQSSSSLRGANRSMRDGEQATARLTQRGQALSAQLDQARTRLDRAGVSTGQLAARQRSLRTEVAQATQQLEAQRHRLERLQAVQQRAKAMHGAGMTATMHGAGFMLAGQRMLRGAAAPLGAAMSFESSMADVKKTVDFDTPKQFAQMGLDVENLSMRLPMLSSEIAQIVAAAGQASIPRQELLRFAEDAVKMGVAFDTTAEESGQTMATWRTAFRMSQDAVVQMADRINYLGNTGPANVQQITEVVNRIGALGEVAGLESGPLAALGATIAGMGIQSEVSATGIKNMLLTLTAGAGATKAQHVAFSQLGLSAVDMSKRMQSDAGGAILLVLDRLRELPEHARMGALGKLFGRESAGAIAPLLTNTELLRENFLKVGDAQRYAGSMEKEYASRVATSENALQLLKNTAMVLSQRVGRTLIPDFKVFAARTGEVVKRIADWVDENPRLVSWLAKSAIAGAALVTVLGGLLIVGGGAAMAFSQIYKAVGLIANSGALTGMARMFGQLGPRLAAMGRFLPGLANGARAVLPLLGGLSAPVVAIGAALAAAGLLVWKFWGPIKAFLIGTFEGARAAFAPVLSELSTALEPLAPAWDVLRLAIGKVGDGVRWLLTPFQATTEQLQGATNAGRAFGTILGLVLANGVRTTITVVRTAASVIAGFGNVVGTIVGAVVTAFRGMWAVITGLFTGNWQQVVGGLRTLWVNINTLLGEWPARMLGFGADMMTGLVNGILGKIPVVGDALTGAVSSAVDRFKTLLGIHSPSRLFAQFGDYTMQGYAAGLQRSQGEPAQAITGMGQRVRAAGAGLAMAAATAPVIAGGGAGPAAPAGGNHYEIHIHAAPGMDPHAIARAITAELDRREHARQTGTRARLRDID